MNYLKRRFCEIMTWVIPSKEITLDPILEPSLDFDHDLCLYTLDQGEFIFDELKIFPTVIEDLILNYCAIYRFNHMKPYDFYSAGKMACTHYYINKLRKNMFIEQIQNYFPKHINKYIQIWFDCLNIDYYSEYYWSLIIEYLVRKEVEYKPTKTPYNVIFICSKLQDVRSLLQMYRDFRIHLNEKWLIRDTILNSNQVGINTINQFNVTFTEINNMEFIDNISYDLIVTDLINPYFTQKLADIYKNSKQLFSIGHFSGEIIAETQFQMNNNEKHIIGYMAIHNTFTKFRFGTKELTKTSYLSINVEEDRIMY